jgi:hypothetical protein
MIKSGVVSRIEGHPRNDSKSTVVVSRADCRRVRVRLVRVPRKTTCAAIGRSLQLVLLVEEGVRKPGGLQGDVEYIPFESRAPEKSFTRIAEMITALGLNSDVPQTGQIATTTSSAIPVQRETDNESSLTPTPDWKDDDYDFAQFRCIMRENKDQAEIVREA